MAFFNSAVTVLQTLVIALGAGLGIWGAINLLEGYGNDNASYNCDITSHKARLIHREDGNYFMAIATVSTQGQKSPVLQKYMKADVRIIVSNKTLWQQVFG